jgi:hypothetical protein
MWFQQTQFLIVLLLLEMLKFKKITSMQQYEET